MSSPKTPTETEIFSAFIALRRAHPDMRIGQLVCNVATWAGRLQPGGVWDMEDSELVATVNRHLYDNPCITAPPHVRVIIEPQPTTA